LIEPEPGRAVVVSARRYSHDVRVCLAVKQRLAWPLLVLCIAAAEPAHAERAIVDSAGRTVVLPDRIERVFAAGPPASVLLYVLAPEKLLGWTRELRGREGEFIAEPYRDIPVLGRLTGRDNTANVEVVLRADPDLIFDMGSTTPTYVSLADRIQAQTNLPYVLIDGRFESTAAALRQLGAILDVEDRAESLARHAEETFAAIDGVLAAVPSNERPRVYLARGPEGLETGVRGSINTEIIERVGAVNVVDVPGQQGLAVVSFEQVLAWDPDVVVTWDRRFTEHARTDPLWQSVSAVKAGRLYLSPSEPFGWIDRPPSINRLLGLRWLARILYPDRFTVDLRQDTRSFFRLFYQVDLTEAQLDYLLGSAP
jgi:iron complex transport system substrate-binding protein